MAEEPTPEQIAAECEEIRKEWSKRTEMLRRGIPVDDAGNRIWNVPTARTTETKPQD